MSSTTSKDLFAQENLLARLDRMPINGIILSIVALLGLVWILEAFDIGIIAPVLLLLRSTWHLQPHDVGLIGSSGTLGIVIGLLPAGRLADRYGRKTTLMGGIVVFSVFTFLGAFSRDVGELLICRFVAGLGQGAVFPVPYLLLSEFVNKHWRGTAVGLANSLLGFAYGLNTLAAALIIGHVPADQAWRMLLMVGGAAIVMIPLIMIYLPESPRFLLRMGRMDKVRALVERLERRSGIAHDDTLSDPRSLQVLQVARARPASLRTLFEPPYLARVVVSYLALMAPFILFYVITIYGPSILHRMGASKSNALYYTSGLLFMTVVTTAIAGSLGDRFSRRMGIIVLMIGTAVGAAALEQPISRMGVILAAAATWGFVYAVFPLAKLYMAEQFPTRLRGTGVMLGECVTRFLGGVVLVYLFPVLSARMSQSSLFTLLAVLSVICILPIWLFGTQTSGRSVEETGTDLGTLAQPAAARVSETAGG